MNEQYHRALDYRDLLVRRLAMLDWTEESARACLEAIESGEESDVEFMVPAMSRINLPLAECFYVSDSITAMLKDVSAEMPVNWVLLPHHLPCNHGFALFDLRRPVAIEWNRVQFKGAGDPSGSDTVVFTLCVTDEDGRFHPQLVAPWVIGEDTGFVARLAAEVGNDIPDPRTKFIAAFLEFINDRILVTTRKRLPRAVQRRLAHAGQLPADASASVIELRKRQYEATGQPGDASDRTYTCQWIVRGHWRQQWYPSVGKHQPKWITPHVKGPEDKPLKTPSADIFAVVR